MAKSPTCTWPASITLLDRMTPSPIRQSWATWALVRNTQRGPTTVSAAAAFGARVHRHMLADQAVLADDEPDRLAAVLEILGLMADRGEREDARARPDRRVAREADVRHEPDAVAEPHLAARHGRTARSRRRRRASRRPRRPRSDGCRAVIRAPASPRPPPRRRATPSTLASPRNHHMFRFLAIRVMWNRT